MAAYLLLYDVVADYLERRAPLRDEHLRLARESHARGELRSRRIECRARQNPFRFFEKNRRILAVRRRCARRVFDIERLGRPSDLANASQ